MTTWRNVTIMQCDDGAAKPLQEARTALADRAAALAKSRVELDEKFSMLSASDLSPKTIKAIESARDAKVASWQDEINLREDYDAWLSEYLAALTTMFDATIQEKAAIEDRVRSELEKIGYVQEERDEATFVPITPEILMRNSHVRTVRFRLADIETFRGHVQSARDANRQGREATKDEMNRFVASVLSAVMGPGWNPAAVA